MMIDILILLLVGANIAITTALFLRVTRNDAEQELDKSVEEAMKRERDAMSEGLDNIMMFSVNGKTGMEPENWQEV